MSQQPNEIMTARVREYIIYCLAKGYYPREVADFAILEFGQEWNLSSEDIEKARSVRKYIYDRTRDFLYEDKPAKAEIQLVRTQWLLDLENASRDANDSFRISEYTRIKELCIKSGDYKTAIQALRMITIEKGKMSFGFNVKGTINHDHRKVETEEEIEQRIKLLIGSSGASDKERAIVVTSISES